jgi:NitT/TauT family transport system substrate-binding protein
LTTVLVATWLLQSCTSDQPDFADSSQGGNCAAASPNAGSAPTAVRVGVTGTLSEAAQYLAQAQGYFAGQGLKVQFINFTSATRMIPALASGQLDVGSGNIGPGLFNPPESNLCVKVVGSLARQEANANGVFLFVRRDLADAGKLRDYADLRGLHVALPGRNTTSEYALAKELETGGLTLKDVRIVQMSFPTMLVSLANKSIDVAMLPESLASAAARSRVRRGSVLAAVRGQTGCSRPLDVRLPAGRTRLRRCLLSQPTARRCRGAAHQSLTH